MRRHLFETSVSQRLAYGLAAGLATAVVPLPMVWSLRDLLGCSVGVAVYLALAWWLCEAFDAKRTRQRAQAQGESPAWCCFS